MEHTLRFKYLTRLVGWGVLYFAFLQWFPSALTSSQMATASPRLGIGVAVTLYAAVIGLLIRRDLLVTTRFWEGVIVGVLTIFLLWVLVQPLFRYEDTEVLRSVSTLLMIVAAVMVGRFLSLYRCAGMFLAGLAPYFAVAFGAGMLVAAVNPEGVWLGRFLGGTEARAWFYWFLVPEPVFAMVSFWAAREQRGGRARPLYTVLMAATLVLVTLTRTRMYLVAIVGVFLVVWVRRRPKSMAVVGVAVAGLLFVAPSLATSVGQYTRLSAFVTGVDPISGREDATNGRFELTNQLLALTSDTGVGAARVREEISTLDASSESGILLMVASYGVPTAAFLIFLLASWSRGLLGVLRSRGPDLLVHASVVSMVPLAAVEWFGTASSFTDWLALSLIGSVFFVGVPEHPPGFGDVQRQPPRRLLVGAGN